MRLEPLYRLTFAYGEHWQAESGGVLHWLLLARGRCEGRISGTFQGANAARRRPDGVFEPDYQGVIESDDGAVILLHLTGYGSPGEGWITATAKHACSDERYAWLNRAVCAVNGTLRDREIVLDVAELVWEPLT
jgi:hypothetical protein